MPTFCRHNRFIERCPICSKMLPGAGSPTRPKAARRGSGAVGRPRAESRRRSAQEGLRVTRELRTGDDGYRRELVAGLRSSGDAARLCEEVAFASARLLALSHDPPGLYGEVRELASDDLERTTWACFLLAYMGPLDGPTPFAGVRAALERGPAEGAPRPPASSAEPILEGLHGLPLGPRTCHEPARGDRTLLAYLQWAGRAGSQALAFGGDSGWSPERRFERVFERLALPGFPRMGRYEMLVTMGRLGMYELRPDALMLASARAGDPPDPTMLGAKRVFGIADPLLLERRAATLARALAVPVEVLDLALGNWASGERATMGMPAESSDGGTRERALSALGL
jgi:Alpha-glutamyl/putrescinyl thymine pyrophosphorylase clade 3